MNQFDSVRALIRTVWPGFVAYLAAQIVAVLGNKIGIDIDRGAVGVVVFAVLLAAIYGAGRWLEQRDNAVAAALGRWLVSVGMDLGQPVYVKPSAGRPLSGTPPGSAR